MEMEIKIGREVSGEHILTIPSTCKRVSRRHASLVWHDGIATIEDNESSNGTFVNGRRIAKTRINENDIVWFGGQGEDGSYQLDLHKVFESCRKAENAQRTDYSQEFESIKQAYIDYKKEEAELKKNITVKSQIPLRILSLIPTLIGAVIAMLPDSDPSDRIKAIAVGGAFTTVFNLVMTIKNSSAGDQLEEAKTELQIKYQPRYCCPKCGMKYPFSTHWRKIEVEGKCLNPKCNAVFVKK